jgi:hypothetical protein
MQVKYITNVDEIPGLTEDERVSYKKVTDKT